MKVLLLFLDLWQQISQTHNSPDATGTEGSNGMCELVIQEPQRAMENCTIFGKTTEQKSLDVVQACTDGSGIGIGEWRMVTRESSSL